MYLNKAFIIGNITRDPELKALPSGGKVCTLSVATNRVWKDKIGAKQEAADFHNIVVFGRQAETTAQYMKKGSEVMIEGRMQTRSWDGADGQKKYRTEVIADRVQFGSSRGGAASSGGAPTGSKAPAKDDFSQDAPMPDAKGDAIEYPEEEINPDEIPF